MYDKQNKKPILLFIVLACGLSWICDYLMYATEIPEFAYLSMWGPGIAAIIVSLLFHRGENAMNFRRCSVKYALVGLGLPIIYWGISYGIYLLVYGSDVITRNEPIEQLIQMPGILLLQLTIFFVTALGEEIGWRGYLTPKLIGRFGFNKGSFIVDVIWTVWHFPTFVAGYMSDA